MPSMTNFEEDAAADRDVRASLDPHDDFLSPAEADIDELAVSEPLDDRHFA